MDGLRIRSAVVDDAPAIARIHWDSWVATYGGIFPKQMFDEFPLAQREELWAREAAQHTDPTTRRQVLVADVGDHVVGFASVGPYRIQDSDAASAVLDGELFAIYLDPHQQRRGFGRALWRASAAFLHAAGFDALRLWCIVGNEAEGFYRAMGALQVGTKAFEAHGTPLLENCYRAATH
jgi:ribosomal protein S18 acetylase RimI-like enzyme